MALPLTGQSPRGLLRAEAAGGLAFLGAPVRVDVSCAFAVALTTWTLADGILPLAAEGRPATAYWSAGALTALVLLASIAAHEVAHCVAARRAGIAVLGVTLGLFGGATSLDHAPRTLRAQVGIALAGPLASLAVAGGAAIAHVALVETGGDGLAVASTAVVALANLGVAAINLLPAAPLDGGLVLHALLARLPGPPRDAAAVVARAGRALGGVILGLAVLASASGDAALGLWCAVVGLVIWEQASPAAWR